MAKKKPKPRKTVPAKSKGKKPTVKITPAKKKKASAKPKAKSGARPSGGSSIDELVRIVPPPKQPVEAGATGARPEAEKKLGLKLPEDLLEIGRHYGTGRFIRGFLTIHNPFSRLYSLLIESEANLIRKGIKLGLTVDRYSVYPKSPGLLPVGMDENGGTLYWFTEGEPHEWPLILRPHGEEELYRADMPLISFLCKTFSNQKKCELWQYKFKKQEIIFQPDRRQYDDAGNPK